MRAAYYERTGVAEDVLQVGERDAPAPREGEVRVRLAVSGVNPADTKRRAGAGGRRMAWPLVVPGDDGAGIIDAVGPGVPPERTTSPRRGLPTCAVRTHPNQNVDLDALHKGSRTAAVLYDKLARLR